jgi:hypothetical protein
MIRIEKNRVSDDCKNLVIDDDGPFTLDEEESPVKPLIFRNCTKKAAVMPMRF